MPDESKVEGHLTPVGITRIANETGTKKITLTHLYPACDERDILWRMGNQIGANIVVTEDLLEITA